LKAGESVLIHAGTGGVGQAAIAIALFAGCIVFTTVGTPDKREYLKKVFPQLNDRYIGNSRDTSFEQLIRFETRTWSRRRTEFTCRREIASWHSVSRVRWPFP
jgi:fatty acid synthase, animal type